ncbi:MAG: hypothetical protein IJF69_05425 [Clostridia bacterium]|nr:hypothetical protein [Clostridia bacterium]
MNPKHLQDAIENIDDAFIEEAASAAKITPKIWIPAAALAACVLLTAILIPWGAILSGNSPSVTDAQKTGTSSDYLQNEDTSSFDSTNDNDNEDSFVNDPTDSTQLSPDTSKDKDSDVSFIPPVTLPPVPDNPKIPDTTGPQIVIPELPEPEDTDGSEKETTVPNIPGKPNPGHGVTVPPSPTVLSYPLYPVQEQYPKLSSLWAEWRTAKDNRINGYTRGIGNTDGFMYCTISEFFSDCENENLIYSPANAYMALGMLAETTQGTSREQLLDLLGEKDIYSLRSSANNLWNSCYRDDGIVTAILGNSMWLDNSFTPKTEVTDILADNYYASTFYGNMGDEEYDVLMREWVNEQTKGILKNTVSNTSLDPGCMMTLMSTLYFKANWTEKFDPEVTRNWIFHSPDGDLSAPFMYKDFVGLLYYGASFKATYLELEEGGEMWFILPNENVSLQSLFSDSEAMGFITGKTQKSISYKEHQAYMWLFLPKFDVNSQIVFDNSLKNTGVTKIFNPNSADFSALTNSNIFVRDITQSVRISIDENGCEAASASGGVLPGEGGSHAIGFALNRPFIFVITSDSGLPLFVGTVNRLN